MKAPSAESHNRVIRRATRRAQTLEASLARIVQPILEQAGAEAARKFERRAAHLTAAGDPGWSPPQPDELLDVDALVSTLRTKTDPVRQAVVETMLDATRDELPDHPEIDFTIANPLAKVVLAQSASQVRDISDTTRLNVMRIISAAHEQGLSIPDTAKAIRVGMTEASQARAENIAITELAGAVNGGSLAATTIVSKSLGIDYYKRWMTAPGAKWPRHETYYGLEGQTVRLDEYFTVGGSMLQHPGDPAGPPKEVCRCRCTMSYTDEPPAASIF